MSIADAYLSSALTCRRSAGRIEALATTVRLGEDVMDEVDADLVADNDFNRAWIEAQKERAEEAARQLILVRDQLVRCAEVCETRYAEEIEPT